MKMIKQIYSKVFAPPTSIELATIELAKAKKAFLEAKTHTEYYAAQVEFECIRIKRLEEYVNVAAGESAADPSPQQEIPTVESPVKTVALTRPAKRKTVTVTLPRPTTRKPVTLAKPTVRKAVK
jgi:hypothetical protein